MQKKLLKIIYVLLSEGKNVRTIKSILKQKFHIEQTENQIRQIWHGYNINKKDGREKYTAYQTRVMLRLYKDFYNTNKVCQYLKKRFGFDIKELTLVNFAFKYGINKSITKQSFNKKTNYLQQKEILKDYLNNNLSTKQLQAKYGYKTEKSIIDIVKKFGYKPRTAQETKTISKSYYGFDMKEINNELKAYYLGLLLTDGWVSQNRVFLDLTDKDVMEFLSKEINVNLVTRQRKHYKRSYRFSITYPSILEDVSRYGLVKNKTHILPKPQFTKEEQRFLPMFLRGVIDGDGWISQDGQEFFISSASELFINYCKDILEKCFGMINLNLQCKNDFYVLRSHKRENLQILREKIYNKPYGMQRKYNRLHNS